MTINSPKRTANSQPRSACSRWVRVAAGAVFLLIASIANPSWAQLKPGQSDQFAGENSTLTLAPGVAPASKKAYWRLNTANRTLTQGVSELKPANELHSSNTGDVAERSFVIKTPEVKPDVVLEVDLFLHFGDPLAETRHALRLHSPDCFVNIRQTLSDAGIALYDPAGITEDALVKTGLTPNVVTSLKRVDTEAIIVIGESIMWDKRIVKAVEQWVSDGKWVIVLRPADASTWPIPTSAADGVKLAFTSITNSRWRPKRLDLEFWSSHAKHPRGWELQVSNNQLRITRAMGPQVWQLAEYQSRENHGGALFVGVPLISRWNESPVPREFLTHIFLQTLPHPPQDP
ncbi:hypothetical protein SH528x_000424 [Novipirellula sp. SH528]|uniref:hypothetical protein n=1 Tax=Novipirellula sp. SH528 TaxID=3454466 RepID=UPI003FA04D60